ncbi:MoaD/ThiS family protein [Klebsiella pneumoniae]|uniref:MoaD/ThiS family protein n=1 Tax=Klebsiella pneumoniae TaxID=573 RepID=UPI0037BF16D4
MEITVKYYGMLAEITGQSTEILTFAENVSVGKFKEKILSLYPEMTSKKFKVAVNLHISDDDILIDSGSEIALLPPFAGG